MNNRRSILFYVQHTRGDVSPLPIQGANVSDTMGALFDTVCGALATSSQNEKEAFHSLDHKDCDFYDWDLNEIPPEIRVRQVPRPGIVLAIQRAGGDTSPTAAMVLKLRIEAQTDNVQTALLQSHLTGPKGQFVPSRWDVFLSYSQKDSGVATELYNALQEKGLSCFFAEMSLGGGDVWEPKIRDGLKEATVVVLLLTPNSVSSAWVMCEAGASWALEKRLIPATMYVDAEKLPEPIKKNQALPIDTIKNRKELVRRVAQLCAGEK